MLNLVSAYRVPKGVDTPVIGDRLPHSPKFNPELMGAPVDAFQGNTHGRIQFWGSKRVNSETSSGASSSKKARHGDPEHPATSAVLSISNSEYGDFFLNLYLHPDLALACEKIRSGKIPVNAYEANPRPGLIPFTVFQEYLRSDPEYHYPEVLVAMIEAGADLNKSDAEGDYPIHQAARLWDAEAIDHLVNAGADVNQADRDGFTALHFAIKGNRLHIVHKLMASGANLEAQNTYGDTPLFCAIENGYVHSAKALLQHQANVYAVNQMDQLPIVYALERAEIFEGFKSYPLGRLVDLLLEHGACFPDDAARQRYIRLLQTSTFPRDSEPPSTAPAIKRFLQHVSADPETLTVFRMPKSADYPEPFRQAALSLFRDEVEKVGPGHPLFSMYGQAKKRLPVLTEDKIIPSLTD